MDQEQIMKFQMIQEEAQQLNQQLQLIEQNVSEIYEIRGSIDEIEKDTTKEFLANLGKKIFIPVEIKEKQVIVEVGNKNFVKKTIPEVKELITEQLGKLNMAKSQINDRLEDLQSEAENLMAEIEKTRDESGVKHKHSHNCECDHEDPDHECSCGHHH